MLIFLSFIGCRKPPKFPDEPVLTFVSLEKIDNGTSIDDKATLKLHFTHGSGNIGFDSTDNYISPFNDPSSKYYYNFYIKYYAKRSGEFVDTFSVGSPNARLPRFTSSNNREPLEGEIEVVLTIRNPIPFSPPIDTIKYECWIIDRDLKESKHVFTSELVVFNK